MSVTINEQRASTEDTVVELTTDEFHAAVRRALRQLGLTYAQLEEQAASQNFCSAQAHSLWTAIGGTVDL